jgi:mRNA interferase RelE/StbE
MIYKLIYTRRAEKDIKKLDPSVRKRIGASLLKLQENPLLHSEQLSDPAIGTYRFRTAITGLFSTSKVVISLCSGLGIERKFTRG